jgi:AcrR family transcriptional regulator
MHTGRNRMMDTSDRILEAGRDLFYEHGYYATSTRVIAQKAGVNEVTLFRHFGTKEDLLKAIIKMDYSIIDTFKDFVFPEEESHDLREDLTRILETFRDTLKQNQKTIAILWDQNMARFDHHFLPFPRKGHELLLSYFKRMAGQGRIRNADYQLLIEQIISTMLGRYQIARRFGSQILQKEDSDFTRGQVDMLVRYLEKD